MCSKFQNAKDSDRNFAVLDFCERLVRDELPDLEDVNTDGPFLAAAIRSLGDHLRVVMRQAAAQTTNAFNLTLCAADSMRVKPIPSKLKEEWKQKKFRCDACGRYEHRCGFCIDLAGSEHDADVWNSKPEHIGTLFKTYMQKYEKRMAEGAASDADGLPKYDMGRFYIGNTCLRKAQLVYLSSTMIQDLLFDMHAKVLTASPAELKSSELLYVTPEAIEDFVTLRRELDLCVANEKRGIPDINIDREFWKLVDEARAVEAAKRNAPLHKIVRERTRYTLVTNGDAGFEDGEMEDSSDEDPLPGDETEPEFEEEDDDDDDDDFIDDSLIEEDEGGGGDTSSRLPRSCQKRSKRSSVVIDDDSEEEEEEAVVSSLARTLRRSTRVPGGGGTSGNAGDPGPSSSGASQKKPKRARPAPTKSNGKGKEPPQPPPQSPPQPPPQPPTLAPKQPAPSATSVATAMRITSPDGTPGPLMSRRKGLNELCSVVNELQAEGPHNDAFCTRLQYVTILYRELLELHEKRRVQLENGE